LKAFSLKFQISAVNLFPHAIYYDISPWQELRKALSNLFLLQTSKRIEPFSYIPIGLGGDPRRPK
jgi:hypothetical protein